MAGDTKTETEYRTKAEALKENVQKQLWDPRREFFFPMSMNEEVDAEGNAIAKHTLTYQSGKYAGSPNGRELHGYVPWQFNLPDPGYEAAWKYLMDKDYFFAKRGPLTVERNDPMFLLKDSCCWWSGQSWPFATTQTLLALANVLRNYKQEYVSNADYVKLLHIFAISHRKNGVPYLAEALHPDTGSFDGHDGYGHSEHYFHSGFNDLVITGLVGLVPRNDDTVEVVPLATDAWPYFALDNVAYRGRNLSIIWDRDGSRYGKGAGLRVLVDGKTIGSRPALGKLTAALPPVAVGVKKQPVRFNYAVNNDADPFPRLTASFTAPETSLTAINDGNFRYTIHPPNRWTTAGSPNKTDSVEVDFGTARPIDTVRLALLDDGKGIVAPKKVSFHYFDGKDWRQWTPKKATPQRPTGHRFNAFVFDAKTTRKIRVVFAHADGGFTGLTELEAWGPMCHHPPAPETWL